MAKYQNSTAHSKWNWSKLVWEIKFFTKLSNWFDSPTTTTVRCVSFIIENVRSIHMQQKQNSISFHFLAERTSCSFFFASSFVWMWKGSFVVFRCWETHSPNYCVCVRFVFITGKRAGYSHEYYSHVYVCVVVCLHSKKKELGVLHKNWIESAIAKWNTYTHTLANTWTCKTFFISQWKQHRAEWEATHKKSSN